MVYGRLYYNYKLVCVELRNYIDVSVNDSVESVIEKDLPIRSKDAYNHLSVRPIASAE